KLQLPLGDVPTRGPAPPTTSPSPTVSVPLAGAPARRRRRRPADAGGPPGVAGLHGGRGRGRDAAGPRARVALRPAGPPAGAGSAAPPQPVPVRGADDFLCLADAHGGFRDALVALAALQAEARAALDDLGRCIADVESSGEKAFPSSTLESPSSTFLAQPSDSRIIKTQQTRLHFATLDKICT
ncbi:DUF241 domain protein, partial [Zea mays]